MKKKTIITAVLLLFIVASIITAIVNENKNTQTQPSETSPSKIDNSSQKIVVFYFHGNLRCKKCKTIEAFTRKAIEERFPEELKNGSMEFKIVNIEDSNNTHYVQDYQLTTRSVVISLQQDNVEKSWMRLDRVWELVNDEKSFLDYIQGEIRTVMTGGG